MPDRVGEATVVAGVVELEAEAGCEEAEMEVEVGVEVEVLLSIARKRRNGRKMRRRVCWIRL